MEIMKLDLHHDKCRIRKFFDRRISEYLKLAEACSGDRCNRISLITVGFHAEQSGYVAISFDRRPDADVDGEWTAHLDESTMMELPHWSKFFSTACSGKEVVLVLDDLTEKSVQFRLRNASDSVDDHSLEELGNCFGDMLANLICEMRDDGTLARLPLAPNAFMVVEDFDGSYFWPSFGHRKTIGRIQRPETGLSEAGK